MVLQKQAKHGWRERLEPARAQLEAMITEVEAAHTELNKLRGDGTALRGAIDKAEALVGWQKGRIGELEAQKIAAAAETGKVFFKLSEKEKAHIALIKVTTPICSLNPILTLRMAMCLAVPS